MAIVEFDRAKFKAIVPRILAFLSQKAMKESRRHDQNHKTYIHEVAFWFEIKYDARGNIIENQDMILSFSATPDLWNYDKILEHIEDQERTWMINSGVYITGYQPYSR